MTLEDPDAGLWTYSTPLPSGTYHYAFLLDCSEHTRDCGNDVPDPDHPPPPNVASYARQSTFQVSFDPEFQPLTGLDLNYDYILPAPEGHRGSFASYNYSSPGSDWPAPNIHDCVVYLPAGYNLRPSQPYPVLYLSHGGGGRAADWTWLGYAHQILDNLIHNGHLEPTVVVMPTFDQLDRNVAPDPEFPNQSPPIVSIRENDLSNLVPFIEETFPVRSDPAGKAFAGLSIGELITYEMLVNATDEFDYFGIFSGALGPGRQVTAYINKTMVEERSGLMEDKKGLFVGAGLYDVALPDVTSMKAALDQAGVRYAGRTVVQGSHDFVTWRELLYWFCKVSLWKGRPDGGGKIEGPCEGMFFEATCYSTSKSPTALAMCENICGKLNGMVGPVPKS